MKHLFIIIALVVTGITANAQNVVSRNEVPKVVVDAYLSQNSSGATDSNWTKEFITIYKVHYIDNGKHYEAQYFSDGKWIRTQSAIDKSELPMLIINRIKEKYPNGKIITSHIELNNDGKFYAVDIFYGNEKTTSYFTMSGKIVY
ncbi:MAG: PepSY-like domain-containing protein [Bacteroidota bacterium]